MATVGKRLLFTVIIVSALLSSAWGNVLAAALCPHFNLKHVCSFKNSAPQPASPEPESHTGMCDMGSDMRMEAADKSQADVSTQNMPADAVDDSNADADTLDQLGEPCPHCLMHSQPASRAIIVQAINPEKRSVESEVSPATSALVSLSAVLVAKPSPNEHAPPGESSRLHLLINVFRI